MHALVVSPIPSHPLTQGNSVRIHSMGRLLQEAGYTTHFLYYPLEGLTPAQTREMSAAWDFFYNIQDKLPNTEMSYATHFAIDDWWDPRLGKVAAELDRLWHYDVCIANYAWFSAVLDWLPARVLKVIDTHDVFADRHVRADAAGLDQKWFFTTREEETLGLSRADIVLAIQDEEETYFRSLGLRRVETVGFITAARFLPRRAPGRRLRVGYIGSANPWNVRSISVFHAALEARPDLVPRLELVLAGPICRAAERFNRLFVLQGVVPDPGDFYRGIDLVVNPMVGGTGLKIKTIEALSYGVPLLSTTEGSAGLNPGAPEHALESVAALLDRLDEIARDPIALDRLRAASRNAFTAYTSLQLRSFDRVFPRLPATR